MMQMLIMYYNCWSYYERLFICWSCYDTLLIMHDDMLIIAMKRLLIIHDVLNNHVIMKVIVTTTPSSVGGSKFRTSVASRLEAFFLTSGWHKKIYPTKCEILRSIFSLFHIIVCFILKSSDGKPTEGGQPPSLSCINSCLCLSYSWGWFHLFTHSGFDIRQQF